MARSTTARKTSHAPRDVARAISLFFAVRGIMRTRIARGKKVDPFTWLRIETMKFISDCGTPMMKEIADHLSITAPSATSLIGGLVKSGLVAKVLDRRDKRASRLKLTAKGEDELKKSLIRGTRLLKGLFDALSEEEFVAFTRALEQMKSISDRR